ncbi:hypothetical protein AOC36_09995 [Erysipelothrix larvae]|uniref:6-phosphogluconolactonase n=1 Tax=Erysipelothrix larvae TaxID=1514105 RepID=A0A120JTY5_9FIRM|nr:lactonase family protein [Erysipelothrix larvae]AMC94290.1 hypothetical protein AOC36_09995 [Erysipelothrix larvae]
MHKVFIGTYTKKDSKGIYTADFDSNTGTLGNLSLLVETNNPTYLDTHKPTNRLFSVADVNGQGGIHVFDLNTTPPTQVATYAQDGNPPCYVHYDEATDTTFDANYHMGLVHAYEKGLLDKTLHYGEGSHAHYVRTHPHTKDLYVCDLGLDMVHKYRLLNEISTYITPKGFGPRHIAFHPTQPVIYVFGELSSEIIVLKDDEFEFTHIQTLSTLPASQQDVKSGAAIRISDDGRFVYASNRGHDSISVFEVNDDASLTMIQNITAGGKHPRDFDITPDQGYLLVANKDTDNISVLKRDKESGLLEVVSTDFNAPEAVCVHFIR